MYKCKSRQWDFSSFIRFVFSFAFFDKLKRNKNKQKELNQRQVIKFQRDKASYQLKQYQKNVICKNNY